MWKWGDECANEYSGVSLHYWKYHKLFPVPSSIQTSLGWSLQWLDVASCHNPTGTTVSILSVWWLFTVCWPRMTSSWDETSSLKYWLDVSFNHSFWSVDRPMKDAQLTVWYCASIPNVWRRKTKCHLPHLNSSHPIVSSMKRNECVSSWIAKLIQACSDNQHLLLEWSYKHIPPEQTP